MAVRGDVKIVDKGALKRVAKICGSHLQEFGENVVERARENTREFKGHKSDDPKKRPTGNLMRNIYAKKLGELSMEIGTKTGYGAYVELGTMHMEAQPYMAPGFDQATKDMEASGPWD